MADKYHQMARLELRRQQVLEQYCSDPVLRLVTEKPQALDDVQQQIDRVADEIDSEYNEYFGSIFTTAWGKTWLG